MRGLASISGARNDHICTARLRYTLDRWRLDHLWLLDGLSGLAIVDRSERRQLGRDNLLGRGLRGLLHGRDLRCRLLLQLLGHSDLLL